MKRRQGFPANVKEITVEQMAPGNPEIKTYSFGRLGMNPIIDLDAKHPVRGLSAKPSHPFTGRREENAAPKTRIHHRILGRPDGPPHEEVCDSRVSIVGAQRLGLLVGLLRHAFEESC